MEDACRPFSGKKITVLGLGLLGRGLGDAAYLAACGAKVLVTDTKDEKELAGPLAELKKYPNVSFRLGGHKTEDFTSCDMVLKAAGVRLDSPEVAVAREAGIPVAMSTALFAKYAAERGARIVGVTGTRGKSTISYLLYHALKAGGRRVHLGGNVRGVSTLAMLPRVDKGDIAVLELDSWQLQGFGDLHVSPHVSVFTNLMPDHQNYYKGMDEYFEDKANIFRYQKEGDVLIVGPMIAPRVRAARSKVEPIIPGELPADWAVKLPGEHMRHNAALAAAALLSLGLNAEEIREGLETFEGVEGRLQLVREVTGVSIYNDNNATTPEATIAALRALDDGKKHIVLIAGGSDKGLELDSLAQEIHSRCKAVVLLQGTGTERLTPLLGSDMIYHITVDSLSDALHAALANAQQRDIVLFSPGFASFGIFKNEYERNDEFLRLVNAL